MNIHEHQAKKILKEFGAPVSKGVVIKSINEIKTKLVNYLVSIRTKSSNTCWRTRKSWWSKISQKCLGFRKRG